MRKLFGIAFLITFLAGGAAAQDKPGAKAQDKPADKVLNGDAKCTACHDENDGNVLLIGQTKHGTRADSRTPTCTSCHGESEAHLKKPAAGGSRAPSLSRLVQPEARRPSESPRRGRQRSQIRDLRFEI